MHFAVAVRIFIAQTNKQLVQPVIMPMRLTHPQCRWVILVSTLIQQHPLCTIKHIITQVMSRAK